MYNPFLTKEESNEIINAVLLVMMCANRLSQTNMALHQVHSVNKSLRALKKYFTTNNNSSSGQNDSKLLSQRNVLTKELFSSSSNLAATLAAKREFVSTLSNNQFDIDPRFLIFEFCHNILLRKPQVVLVRKLLEEMRASKSVCYQMIMGAGKTTVVGPLLAMLLADSNTLMVEVVPNPLLDFSAGVLRERFSSVIRKPVFTFTYDRYKKVFSTYYYLFYFYNIIFII